MLTSHIALGLVTAALFSTPALAQTSTAPGSTAPGVQSPSTQAPSAASSARLGTSHFLSSVSGDQVRFSKLKGLDVYGPNNEKIGDLREVLLAHDGRAEAAVIGVGGFLGVGEKEVAVPFSSLQWRDRPRRRTRLRPPAHPRAALPAAKGPTTRCSTSQRPTCSTRPLSATPASPKTFVEHHRARPQHHRSGISQQREPRTLSSGPRHARTRLPTMGAQSAGSPLVGPSCHRASPCAVEPVAAHA